MIVEFLLVSRRPAFICCRFFYSFSRVRFLGLKRSATRLKSAVFQLTPTRTRFDLVIVANGKTKKIVSGLVNPFLSHLKTAQDQISKGGYSIKLEPDPSTEAAWFTKETVESFVSSCSTSPPFESNLFV
ncbi:hypothetical protein HPP92_004774 [Vanilla planifolia]|uniref:Uncharacterized protein n=1 Tax=Vanilla planifolia TaxID=51239 RepID=A0A835VE98_VANPL|nr:hypothetical protein HPP92_005129 [Vanilla planifolia]KAG0493780.1 hypothetical protein HPP92_004774 [Vanilla planifolia]